MGARGDRPRGRGGRSKQDERVGALRADVIARGRKARLTDALIAQSCLDHEVPLITRDADFRNFSRVRDLQLLVAKP